MRLSPVVSGSQTHMSISQTAIIQVENGDTGVELETNVNETFLDAYKTLCRLKNTGQTDLTIVTHYLELIDVNYEQGLFFLRAAQNNDLEMLQMLATQNPEIGSLQDALLVSARDGYTECVQFLLDQGADPSPLIVTSAYNNHSHIKELINQKSL